jgi:hypothetical protein
MGAEEAYQAYLYAVVANRTYKRVQYFSDLHELLTVDTLITHVGPGGAITLLSGEVVAYTQVVSVGGTFAPTYQGYEVYCTTCDQ